MQQAAPEAKPARMAFPNPQPVSGICPCPDFFRAVSVNRNPKDGTSATSTGEMAGENRRKDFPFLAFRFRPTVPD